MCWTHPACYERPPGVYAPQGSRPIPKVGSRIRSRLSQLVGSVPEELDLADAVAVAGSRNDGNRLVRERRRIQHAGPRPNNAHRRRRAIRHRDQVHAIRCGRTGGTGNCERDVERSRIRIGMARAARRARTAVAKRPRVIGNCACRRVREGHIQRRSSIRRAGCETGQKQGAGNLEARYNDRTITEHIIRNSR